LVLAGSLLATRYKKGDYVPLRLEAAVSQTKALYLLFRSENIPVIRMGLQATEDFAGDLTILAGPYHPAFGHLVYSEIFLDMATAAIKSANSNGNRVCLHVHPRSVSKMRGLKNQNIKKLRRNLQLESIEIVPDDSLKEDRLNVSSFI
jgi:histone acetyltransferase (RNA polymerase elongator complex component)